MATAAFKSNTRRSNGYGGGNSPKTNPPNPNSQPQKQRLRRSLSVNALSRSTQIDVSSEFLNKRDNPLFWATGGSPADSKAETPTTSVVAGDAAFESKVSITSDVAVGQRGRSVKRNSELGSGGQKEEIIGRRRSLSRVNDNGGGNGNSRRGRSVSRAKLAFGASESEAEQESVVSTTYGGRSSYIRASSSDRKLPVSVGKASDMQDRSLYPSRHPSVVSAFDSQVSNWEDGISTGSLSEAEEKTIKAVYEQMKSFKGSNSREDTASSDIYETVRSEVRRAIADIQDDLEHAIQRNKTGALANTDVTDTPPDLVKPGAVELVLDIRREYAKELEESQERARKLRSDLAIEEHRRQELSRILKETLPEPKISVSQRSRFGRKNSSERKKMSKHLTDEAMSYFDECVSISTFDSSDFSAAEDSAVNSVDTTFTTGATTSIPHDTRCISASSGLNSGQMMHGDPGSGSTAHSSGNNLASDRVVELTDNAKCDWNCHFSFGEKRTQSMELQQDIRNYIKSFEKDGGINGISSERSGANYDIDAYDLLDVDESLMFDKVFFKNWQESGRLHICGGVAVPFLPFAHLF